EPHLLRTCGRPVAGVQARVVDDNLTPLPMGEVGEIVIRGPTVMKGYWNRPEETAAALRGGWLHMGDLGSRDAEGFITLVDRKKDMIVTGGENVFSPEVENALAAHPEVIECAVIAVPDDRFGERVHAVVVLAEGATTDAAALQAHCRTLIGGYKVPRSFDFMESLPK
ncbi:MAG: AMP-binding protein, partial [Myxococcales bacterium]|nr:AMP-binding protein [Myxococcales bacterium]